MMTSVQITDWASRMSAALAVQEAAAPEDLAAATLAVNVLAIEFKRSNVPVRFQDYAETESQPRIEATDPNDGDVGIALDAVLTVTFSEAMDPATALPAAFLVKPDLGSYTAVDDVTLDGTGKIASLTVSGGFDPLTRHWLRVLTTVKDLNGQPLWHQFDHADGFVTAAS